jgi:hypothetical protein
MSRAMNKIDTALMLTAKLEQIAAEPGELDHIQVVTTAELLIAEAPNAHIAKLARRIVYGIDRSGIERGAANLLRDHLQDMVMRLRLALEVLKAKEPPLPMND